MHLYLITKSNVILSSQMFPMISFNQFRQSKSLLLVYDILILINYTHDTTVLKHIFDKGKVWCNVIDKLHHYFGLNISCFVVFSHQFQTF